MTRRDLRVWLSDEANFCGCGDPEAACKTLLALLRLQHPGSLEGQRALIADEGARYLLLYWITALDLAEHGTGVDGSWLTDKGREVMAALEAEEGDGFAALCESCCVHGYTFDEECPRCPNE